MCIRDSFFYSQQMDMTDHALVSDMLTIMHDMIRRSSKHAIQQSYYAQQSSIMQMQDCFYFCNVSRGVLLLNDVAIGTKDKEELFMTILFKVDLDQI